MSGSVLFSILRPGGGATTTTSGNPIAGWKRGALVAAPAFVFAAGRPDAAWLEALRWAYLAFYVWVGALATLLSASVLSSVQRVFPAEERDWLVSLQVGDENGRTMYFATSYAWLNGVNLALLAFGTPRLIQRFGLGFALVSLPLAAALGALALLLVALLLAWAAAAAALRPALRQHYGAGRAGKAGP